MTDPTTRETIDRLRELCAWYEWDEPPRLPTAGLLQDTADHAYQLDAVIVRATIEMFEPLAWAKPRRSEHEERLDGIVIAIRDLKQWLEEAPEEEKPRIRARLAEQLEIWEQYS